MAETGYCVKCKNKKEMKDEQKVTMKNGRKALKGKCSVCGTTVFKFACFLRFYLVLNSRGL